MTTRTLLLSAGMVGLIVSIVILTLMAFGVAGTLFTHEIDLMRFLWPSSLILTTGWRTTAHGITLTVIAVLLNCLTYSVVAVLLGTGFRSTANLIRWGHLKDN